jgi:hypothetical protein
MGVIACLPLAQNYLGGGGGGGGGLVSPHWCKHRYSNDLPILDMLYTIKFFRKTIINDLTWVVVVGGCAKWGYPLVLFIERGGLSTETGRQCIWMQSLKGFRGLKF